MTGSRLEKGRVSNLVSFVVLVVGAVISSGLWDGGPPWVSAVGPWVLATGMFGFAGGITNWLAVTMLFDKVPLLYGSGVIPNRFREIRTTIKDLIMQHFFDEEYLHRFFEQHGFQLTGGVSLEKELTDLLASDQADEATLNPDPVRVEDARD